MSKSEKISTNLFYVAIALAGLGLTVLYFGFPVAAGRFLTGSFLLFFGLFLFQLVELVKK